MLHNDNGRMVKLCLLHACLPSNCGCPDEVSQADRHVETRVIERLPFDHVLYGKKGDGPLTLIEETVRTATGSRTTAREKVRG